MMLGNGKSVFRFKGGHIMQRKSLLLFVLSLAFILFLGDFQNADAQRRRGGGRRGGGWGGYNGGYYGNNGWYGNGWYGPGYGNGWYGSGYGGRGYYGGRGGYWGDDGYWYYDNSMPYDDSSYSYYPPDNYASDQNQRAFVTVRVPDGNAQVWIQNKLTQQMGLVRNFQTRPLEPGNYTYKIRAKWQQNGRDMERTRTVQLQPGQSVTVDFNQNQGSGNNQQPEVINPSGSRSRPPD
jgi:uncharacterized protein (TIGR03000 family)